ncbi:hypothetical protein [Cellulomonas sp. APG4]|uniref:hypothetical protein n=1 Tax=Cellulomonas sp. APG4 TaxID=1538656 RepID=UPI00192A3D85|nr:hypothetical protein [Cellulomonas sp. APG4]
MAPSSSVEHRGAVAPPQEHAAADSSAADSSAAAGDRSEPDVAAARAWLAAAAPLDLGPLGVVAQHQRPDGSWGASDDARRRVLPTLWTASLLGELGAGDGPAWQAAAEFLRTHGSADDGVFSRTARRDGVLSCYVAIAATTYLRGGRTDLARPQVEWLLRHQDVCEHGVSRRGGVERYEPGLAVRYGGCLASTSCLIGVVKAGCALELWRRTTSQDGPGARELDAMLAVVREALLERGLMRTRSGGVLPLGVPAHRPEDWLRPTFPLDWRTDLVEVLGLVTRTGPPDTRTAAARARLASWQLPDGGWPLLRAYWPPGFPPLERTSARRASRLVTRRVLAALS